MPDAPKKTDPKLLEILVCPLTKAPLAYDAEKQELVSRQLAENSLTNAYPSERHAMAELGRLARGFAKLKQQAPHERAKQGSAAIPRAESIRQIQLSLWRAAAKLSIVRSGNDPALAGVGGCFDTFPFSFKRQREAKHGLVAECPSARAACFQSIDFELQRDNAADNARRQRAAPPQGAVRQSFLPRAAHPRARASQRRA